MAASSDRIIDSKNSTKETVDSLSGDNTRLQAKVMELEESSKYLLRENQQLAESTSGLQSQIQNLEKSIASAHTSTMQPMFSRYDKISGRSRGFGDPLSMVEPRSRHSKNKICAALLYRFC